MTDIIFVPVGFISSLYRLAFLAVTILRLLSVSIARPARRFSEAEIPFPRIWHRAGSKGSEAPAGPVLVLKRGRKKVRGGLES